MHTYVLAISKRLETILSLSYFISLAVYCSQGTAYESNLFTTFSALVVYGLSILYWYRYFQLRCSVPLFKCYMVFIVYLLAVWFVTNRTVNRGGEVVTTFPFIQYIIVIATTAMSTFLYAYTGRLNQKALYVYFVIMCFLSLQNYFFFIGESEISSFIGTNNFGYDMAVLIPMTILFWDKKLLMYFLAFALFIMTLASGKRGAMLIGIMFLLCMFWYQRKEDNLGGSKISFKNVVLIGGGIYVVYRVVLFLLSNSAVFVKRLIETQEGSSSGRDVIYRSIWEGYIDSDFFGLFFGNGIFTTIYKVGNYAHNDYLEILYDTGFIGAVLMILIYASVLKVFKSTALSFNYKCVCLCVTLYLFVRSAISMCIYELSSVSVFIMLGLVLGIDMRYKNSTK